MTARYRLALTLLTGMILILSAAYLWRTQELRAAFQEMQEARSEARRFQAEMTLSRRRNEDADQAGLERFARRVTHALCRKDWNALRPLCASRLVLGLVTCVYRGQLTPEQNKELLSSESLNAVLDSSPESGRGRCMALMVTLNTNRALLQKERQEFDEFCGIVKATETEAHSGWIDISADSVADDHFPFFGPAINGKVCSNDYWRIEMEPRNGEWRVTRLLETLH